MTAATIATGFAAARHGPGRETGVRRLGATQYEPVWRSMQEYTSRRGAGDPDEIWVTEHFPVYTLGLAGREQHLPRDANGIPVIRTDRGGQITYHGPGQIVVYLLLDLRRNGLSVRPLVRTMEQAVIDLLADYAIVGERRAGAPGVYVGGAKIAAVGLRVRNGCCYHGLAFNADLDLSPFHAIDPCGYPGLAVTQARDLGITDGVERLGESIVGRLLEALP